MEKSPLRQLPAELRLVIFDYVLPFGHEVRIESIASLSTTKGLPYLSRLGLLQVCRQVNREAVKLVYATSIIFTPAAEGTPSHECLEKFITSIGDINAADLREVRLASTLSPGMFGNGNLRRSLMKTKEIAERIPSCAVKVLLTFLDVYKSIAIRVQLNLRARNLKAPGDEWIEILEPITKTEGENLKEVQDSMDFLKDQLSEYKQDLVAS